jgi:hypothetical protein
MRQQTADSRQQSGLTLTELLLAASVAVVVALGIGTLEGNRTRMAEEILSRTGVRSEEGQAALATVRLAESIATADRFSFDGGNRLFRIPRNCIGGAPPAPGCFDDPASYEWDQYQLTGGELRWYRNIGAGCGDLQVMARNITVFTLAYQEPPGSVAPPGGDPATPGDNNLLQYAVTWDNQLAAPRNRTHTFSGWVMGRAIPYSDVNTTATQSGSGLAPAVVSPPPAVVCP